MTSVSAKALTNSFDVERNEPWPDLPGLALDYGRDCEIFGEGEPAERIYRVLSGVVRTYRVLADGRRQIQDFFFPGDLFGLEASIQHGLSAEAVTDCQIVAIRRRDLMKLAATDPATAARFWSLIARELRRSQDHILMLGRRSAAERVAAFLSDSAARLHAGDSFELPMGRQDMADFLGLTVETVSRVLTQFQSDGLIRLPRCRRVVLRDAAGLTQLCA